MDANEYLNKGKLSISLPRLGIKYSEKEITVKKRPAMHFRYKVRLMEYGPQNTLTVMQQDFYHCDQE